MSTEPQIQPELGTGRIDCLLVGRDLGSEEVKKGRPFANMHPHQGAGYVLEKVLTEAGIRRKDLVGITNVVNRKPPGNNFPAHSQAAVRRGLSDLSDLIEELQPNLVVTLGNVAAHALVDDWPTKRDSGRLRDAKNIRERRGYVWRGRHGGKVLTTVHPSMIQRGGWVPFRLLMVEDFKKARQEARTANFNYPEREIEVVV